MGNGVGKLSLCFAGDAGAVSRRRNDIAVYLSDPLDEGYGHSFCYFHHDSSRLSAVDSVTPAAAAAAAAAFKSISGASLSANTSTPLSTAPIDLHPNDAASFDKPSSFASSDSFAAIPLQPIPRNSIPSVQSGPILGTPGAVSSSGPIGRGFLSGPIERSFISGPLENQYDHLQRYKPKSKKLDLIKNIKKAIINSIVLPIRGVGWTKDSDWAYGLEKNNENGTVTTVSSQASLADDSEEPFENPNIQWAQGKSGEDRVHIVISEEHDWVFVGIYDGFNGPDATDYLLNNLYSNVQKELIGLLWNDNSEESAPTNFAKTEHVSRNSASVGANHSEVLKALSEGLKKTEDSFLELSDFMLMENPELSLMGSCVLVMLMKGEDVYLMNVGDSRAVLARKDEPDLGIGKVSQELERINEESSNGDEFDSLSNLTSLQLTVDHNTSTEEEVKKIKKEHPDDASAIANDRVKGSLKVTRAFGAGFLKQPKWNNALLEMFRIDYMGSSPYISCSPSLYHHRLGPRDRFLILSSDGLYQYFTNEEAVSQIESFVSSFPEGDPAQHLVEQVLFRAAKKAGMDFHELLDIPQGDRRRYHDDVSIIIISFEGRLWRSSSV